MGVSNFDKSFERKHKETFGLTQKKMKIKIIFKYKSVVHQTLIQIY